MTGDGVHVSHRGLCMTPCSPGAISCHLSLMAGLSNYNQVALVKVVYNPYATGDIAYITGV